MKLRNIIPYGFRRRLFGDRNRYPEQPDPFDKDWIIWKEKAISDFYENTQKRGIGNWVCNLAYPVVAKADFKGKSVLEIGPGAIRHLTYMKSKPISYTICDIEEKCLNMSRNILDQAGLSNEAVLLDNSNRASLPFKDEQFDFVLSFNTLEHLHPLDAYLKEMIRVVKKKGILLGGVPCEGGLAWGLGRLLTTRRYVHKNYGINYDKIICWEHPNYADQIIEGLEALLTRHELNFYPFPLLSIDFNLVASFIYQKC